MGIGLTALGIILELLQWTFGYRALEAEDALVNIIGITVAWLLTGTRFATLLEWSEATFLP